MTKSTNTTPIAYRPIAARGRWPVLPVAARVNASRSTLFAWGEVPVMDNRGEDYRFQLEIMTADPDQQLALARLVSIAVNNLPRFIDTMEYALQKLDSVAFLSVEGDTNVIKQSLRQALTIARGEAP